MRDQAGSLFNKTELRIFFTEGGEFRAEMACSYLLRSSKSFLLMPRSKEANSKKAWYFVSEKRDEINKFMCQENKGKEEGT